MKTLLVTGASGFLGQIVAAHAPADWQLLLSSRHGPWALDLTLAEAIPSALESWQPTAIMHLAAAANPNFCAENPAVSSAVNFRATQALGAHAAAHHLPFLFTSTDLVFGGTRAPYQPSATPDPINIYGEHKAAAEAWLLAHCPTSCIARLPLMYGSLNQPNHFLAGWHQQLQSGQSIGAFVDEWRTPAYAPDVVAGLFLLLDQSAKGIWHLGGPERLSRWTMAQTLAEKIGADPVLVQPQHQRDVRLPAARPADVSLDSQATYQLGYHPRSWTAGLDAATIDFPI